MTGMGRTGKNFAIEHWDIAPDILIAAKGLSSGYAPLGAVIATKKVVDGIASGAFLHGFTYNAHPISLAAGRAVLHHLQQQKLVQAADSGREGSIAAKLERSLSTLLDLKTVGDVRGIGLLRGVEFVSDKQSKKPFAPELNFAGKVGAAALKRGLLVYPMQGCVDGVSGDHLLIAPPAVITAEQIDWAVEQLKESIEEAGPGSAGFPPLSWGAHCAKLPSAIAILHEASSLLSITYQLTSQLTRSLPAVHCAALTSPPNWLREQEMASPMIDFCEQANPSVLTEVRRIKRFENATRIHNGLTSNPEKRPLIWMAERTPRWINSDHLTLLGFAAQVMAGVSYALARWNRYWLLAGHRLSGTQLAGRQPRRHAGPGAPATTPALRLLCGPHCRQLRRAGAHGWAGALGIHASLHRDRTAGRVSAAFHPVLPGHLHAGRISTFVLELRADRIADPAVDRQRGAVFRPMVFHGHYRLFDVGGAIGLIGMSAMLIFFTVRNTRRLYLEERIR